MAKKVVATLSTGAAKKLTKLIHTKKSSKTGAYTFKSSIIPVELVKETIGIKA